MKSPMVLLVSIWIFGVFVSIEGEEQVDLAILVDVPWTELRDFSAVLSALESKSSLRIHRFNLVEDVDWQVGHFMRSNKKPNDLTLLCTRAEPVEWRCILQVQLNSRKRLLERPCCSIGCTPGND
jgi:hypothetical protein